MNLTEKKIAPELDDVLMQVLSDLSGSVNFNGFKLSNIFIKSLILCDSNKFKKPLVLLSCYLLVQSRYQNTGASCEIKVFTVNFE